MKTKKTAAIIAIVIMLLLGVGAWALFVRQSAPSPSDPLQSDTVAPTITLNISDSSLKLASSQKVLEVSADVSDNQMIIRVEYLLDGKVVARSIEPPFKATINIAMLDKGKHTLQAVAYDAAGNIGKSKIFTFTIEGDGIEAADEESQAIVRGSSRRSSAVTTASSSNTTSSNNNSGGSTDSGGDSGEGARTAGGWWASLPSTMQVCTGNAWNGGPNSAPAGAITVPAGDNTGFNFNQASKTFWFAPGEHTLGTGEFSQITPGASSTYIGAPGAILDGKNNNRYAFTGTANNVRIAYLEIRNFGRGLDNNNEGVINHDSGTGWTMEYLYAHHNDGAAVFIGTDNIVRNNCLKDNGQYGFSMFKPQVEGDSAIKNIIVHNNEISGNNQDDWETLQPGCGCTGAGKFWDVEGATVTNNYVHHNLSTGLWADTNDTDFLFDSNWIERNEGEGIWYEISYNATISRNVLKENAWTTGVNNQGSPGPAIYISESGGDNRLVSTVSGSTNLRINNNLLLDNFSGISIFENSNRFCNSNGNTSTTYCTPFVTPTIIPPPYNNTYPNPINATHPCYTNIANAPYTTDCRWHSKNVDVFSNEFRFTTANVPCAGSFCGVHALFATGANNIPWAPAAYNVATVQNNVMHNNNNHFYNNAYYGDWRFVKGGGERINWFLWRDAPFNQDVGSTIADQTPVANALDTNTATLESAIGRWQNWFSTTVERSSLEAHTGTHSLRVNVTAGGSWGVQLDNHPGFEATPGPKRVSFWAKQGTGAITNVTLRVEWYNTSGSIIGSHTDIPISSLSTSWQEGAMDITAPSGTATVYVSLLSSSGGAGNTLFVDDVVVADST